MNFVIHVDGRRVVGTVRKLFATSKTTGMPVLNVVRDAELMHWEARQDSAAREMYVAVVYRVPMEPESSGAPQ